MIRSFTFSLLLTAFCSAAPALALDPPGITACKIRCHNLNPNNEAAERFCVRKNCTDYSPALSTDAIDAVDTDELLEPALSRQEQCKDDARIQAGFMPGENTRGQCRLNFTGSREGTRTCPGLLLFWSENCSGKDPAPGQTCCN